MTRRPRIVVVGSINMDLVYFTSRLSRPGETRQGHGFNQIAGGKGANQAVAAARLGAEVALVGRIGDDGFGQTLITGLRHEGIDVAHVTVTSEMSSGLAVIGVEDSGQNTITVIPGANGLVTSDDVLSAEEIFRNADVLLLQFEIPLPAIITAIEIARRHNVRIILDPAPSIDHVPAEVLQVDVVCPNETEAESLSAMRIKDVAGAMKASQEIQRLGPMWSVITLGSEGAVVFDGQQCQHVRPFSVKAVDTTAAGDAFAAGLGIALAEGQSIFAAARFANAAGALATTQRGAQPAMPLRAAVDALLLSHP